MKKICVVTTSRADYGILKPLADEIKRSKLLRLQMIASGTHLSCEFGMTYREIEKDGFQIDEKLRIVSSSDTPVGIAKSMSLALAGFAEAYERLKPDMIVIMGDRYELLGAAAAALVARIPVAHIHGGEVTQGAIDDAIRHSITKMSHLHFTAMETYRKRVIQLGEDPGCVFNVGSLGLDNIKKMKLLSRAELEKSLAFKFRERNLMVTFHPVTLENNTSQCQFKALLSAIDGLGGDTVVIFTKTNADTYGRIINKMVDSYVSENPGRTAAFASLGQLRYLSCLNFVDGVVGNSSSGIIEAPSFKIGTINIGDRQKGRVRAQSVIDCKPDVKGIRSALKKLYSPEFRKKLKYVSNPYNGGYAASRICKILEKRRLDGLIKKAFHDVRFNIERGL